MLYNCLLTRTETEKKLQLDSRSFGCNLVVDAVELDAEKWAGEANLLKVQERQAPEGCQVQISCGAYLCQGIVVIHMGVLLWFFKCMVVKPSSILYMPTTGLLYWSTVLPHPYSSSKFSTYSPAQQYINLDPDLVLCFKLSFSHISQ